MFVFLIPRNYTEALEFDKANNNSKWYDATKAELDSYIYIRYSRSMNKHYMINKRKLLMHPQDIRKSEFIVFLQSSMMVEIKPDLLLMDILLQNLLKIFTQELFSLRNLKLVIFLGKLNNLELWGADIGNAYLEAPTEEKLYIVAGPEFEDWEGYILTFSKALYWLKSSGKRWAETLHDILKHMNFIPSRADQCIWLKKNNKLNLYEYIVV